MWSRSELKIKGKKSFINNYWSCVLVALVLSILVGTTGNISFNFSSKGLSFDGLMEDSNYMESDEYYYYNEGFIDGDEYLNDYEDSYQGNIWENDEMTSEMMGIGFLILSIGVVVILVLAVIAIVVRIFLCLPIEVGGCRFFVENAYEKATPSKLFFGFTCGHYKHLVFTLFLRDLYCFLWGLLFIFPGIIKSYEYRMVPYLLADCPDMPREDAFSISKEMMYGNKWKAFVLDFSFIGWILLNTVTCGILGWFWTNPYIYATNAELFLFLKQGYFANYPGGTDTTYTQQDTTNQSDISYLLEEKL